MPKFTPPLGAYMPVVTENVPTYQQRPWAYFKPQIRMGVNVWIYTDNTISETQPPLWEARTVTDSQGNIVSVTPGVKKVYYGGHTYDITEGEKQMLTRAGYGDNIVG